MEQANDWLADGRSRQPAGEMAATFWMNVIKEPFIKSKYHPTTPTCPIRKVEKMDLNVPEFLTLIYYNKKNRNYNFGDSCNVLPRRSISSEWKAVLQLRYHQSTTTIKLRINPLFC